MIACLSFIVVAQGAQPTYRRCKRNTELCIPLRCSLSQPTVNVPFSYHYLCCNGKRVLLISVSGINVKRFISFLLKNFKLATAFSYGIFVVNIKTM